MFLDDELNKIHEENGISPETSQKLINACSKRIESDKGIKMWLNSFKRIDASWKLFCEKHNEYNPDGFRIIVLKTADEELSKKLKEALNW